MRNGAKNMQANEVLRLESGGVLSLYVPPKTVRGVVLICPGGGYRWVAPREGEPVARAFNAGGWAAAVLEYTCYQGKPLGKLPLKQAGEAMRVLRQRFAFRRAAIWRRHWAFIGKRKGCLDRMG